MEETPPAINILKSETLSGRDSEYCPKPPFPVIQRELSCTDVGFCLDEVREEGLFEDMGLFSENISNMLRGDCTFAKRNADAIARSALILSFVMFRLGSKLDIVSTRVCTVYALRKVACQLASLRTMASLTSSSIVLPKYRVMFPPWAAILINFWSPTFQKDPEWIASGSHAVYMEANSN